MRAHQVAELERGLEGALTDVVQQLQRLVPRECVFRVQVFLAGGLAEFDYLFDFGLVAVVAEHHLLLEQAVVNEGIGELVQDGEEFLFFLLVVVALLGDRDDQLLEPVEYGRAHAGQS